MFACVVQVVLSRAITAVSPAYLWLGGGEVDLKLRLPTQQLIAALHTPILSCTVPVAGDGDESD